VVAWRKKWGKWNIGTQMIVSYTLKLYLGELLVNMLQDIVGYILD